MKKWHGCHHGSTSMMLREFFIVQFSWASSNPQTKNLTSRLESFSSSSFLFFFPILSIIPTILSNNYVLGPTSALPHHSLDWPLAQRPILLVDCYEPSHGQLVFGVTMAIIVFKNNTKGLVECDGCDRSSCSCRWGGQSLLNKSRALKLYELPPVSFARKAVDNQWFKGNFVVGVIATPRII